MKWISVKDRLPEDEGFVLIHAPSADEHKPVIITAWHDTETREWGLVDVWANAVTHWMPLPVPPKGDN